MKSCPALPPIPPPSVAVIDPRTGLMTKYWYDYVKAQDALFRELRTVALADLADVTVTAPADTEVLTYSTADTAWINA